MMFLTQIALAAAAIQLNFTLENKPSMLKYDRNGLLNRRDFVEVETNLTSSYNFYYTKLLLGTPPQELDVIVDTGSPVTWVFGPNASAAGDAPKFNPDNSSTWQEMPDFQFSAAYGSGSYRGIWGNDSAAIPEYDNKTIKNFDVGVISTFEAGASAPGLLALGPHIGYAGPSTYKNFPEALLEQGLIDSAGFSINLVNQSGTILFGGVDMGAIEQPIYWYNYTATSPSYAGFYTVPLTSLTINGQPSHDVRYPAMIDTGSPMSLVPTSFVEQVGKQWNLANVTSYRAFYLDDGSKPEDLQGWVTFQIGYFQIDIPISDLFIPGEFIWGANGPQNVSALSLMGSMNNILGDAFIRHVYCTFDSKEERVYLSRRKTANTTLPDIVSPANLTRLAIPGNLAVTESSATFVTSATQSGVLYGPAQYLGEADSQSLTAASATGSGAGSESAGSASASATSESKSAASGSAAGSQSGSSAGGSGSGASSSANAALWLAPSFAVCAFALML